jgi:hypothetical protein
MKCCGRADHVETARLLAMHDCHMLTLHGDSMLTRVRRTQTRSRCKQPAGATWGTTLHNFKAGIVQGCACRCCRASADDPPYGQGHGIIVGEHIPQPIRGDQQHLVIQLPQVARHLRVRHDERPQEVVAYGS